MGTLLAPYTDPSIMSWKGFFAKIFGIYGKSSELAKWADKTLTADEIAAITDPAERALYNGYQGYLAAQSAISVIEIVLWIIIGIVGLAAVVYAIYLGVNLARASEQGKRDEAKKHLITVIIAIVVTLALVIFALYLLPGILGAFQGTAKDLTTPEETFISMLK